MFDQEGHTTHFDKSATRWEGHFQHGKSTSLGVAYVSRLTTKTQNNEL